MRKRTAKAVLFAAWGAKLPFSGVSHNPSPGEKVDSKTTGTGGFEDGSGMRAVTLRAVQVKTC